jgi:hypothetical protein
MASYDSGPDTLRHIARVGELLDEFASELSHRGKIHDQSKLGPIEKPALDALTPELRPHAYGTDEYKVTLARYQSAIAHHHAVNSHHPEHYADGVSGMNLFDLVEMFCDWRAASERTRDGSLAQSIAINVEKFEIQPQLAAILRNTADLLFLRSSP